MAAYWAAFRRWPKAKISLRQDARVVHMSWRDWCHLSPVVLRPIR